MYGNGLCSMRANCFRDANIGDHSVSVVLIRDGLSVRFVIMVTPSIVCSGTRDQGSVLACVALFSDATVDTFVQERVFEF